jgi:hypothetical protein
MTRSSQRCVDVKVDVERRDDLAMMPGHRSTWWRFVGVDIQHVTAWLWVELLRPYTTCTCATWALAACCLVSGTWIVGVERRVGVASPEVAEEDWSTRASMHQRESIGCGWIKKKDLTEEKKLLKLWNKSIDWKKTRDEMWCPWSLDRGAKHSDTMKDCGILIVLFGALWAVYIVVQNLETKILVEIESNYNLNY